MALRFFCEVSGTVARTRSGGYGTPIFLRSGGNSRTNSYQGLWHSDFFAKCREQSHELVSGVMALRFFCEAAGTVVRTRIRGYGTPIFLRSGGNSRTNS